MSARPDVLPTSERRSRTRPPVTTAFLASVLVAMLSIQFLLGTYLETFVTLPADQGAAGIALDGLVVLVLHILVAFLLVGLSLRLLYTAVRSRSRRSTVLTGLAAAGVLVAFLGGMDFTFGAHEDVLSFIMASGSFLAMLCAGVLLAGASRTLAARTAASPHP